MLQRERQTRRPASAYQFSEIHTSGSGSARKTAKQRERERVREREREGPRPMYNEERQEGVNSCEGDGEVYRKRRIARMYVREKVAGSRMHQRKKQISGRKGPVYHGEKRENQWREESLGGWRE